MFTIEQINAAHSKVKSGADFPRYIRELNSMGVDSYETYVTDGHTIYFGTDNYSINSGPKYAALNVAGVSDALQFQLDLKAHQQGHTDYPAFCKHCAHSGVEKWRVDMAAMTCTYFSKTGQVLLAENIPAL